MWNSNTTTEVMPSLLFFQIRNIKTEKVLFNFNFYSESDWKNQNYLTELSDEDKQILSESGDNETQIFSNSIDSVAYNNEVSFIQKNRYY